MQTLGKTCTAIAFIAALTLASSAWAGVNEKVVYTFGGSNGAIPQSKLVYTSSGELFGTTEIGGNTATCPNTNGCGVVFELSAPNHGVRNYRLLYVFNGGTGDGQLPLGNIVFDGAGNLYGVTEFGGPGAGSYGGGTVYKLSPAGGGLWTETVIHTFGSGSDGLWPLAGLTADAAGNLYGTTSVGGTNNSGTVYKLTPNSDGSWSETILYSFGPHQGADGYSPAGEVILDATGNIYGTTVLGGTLNFGLVFELSPNSGAYTETILYSFTGHKDQGQPGFPLWMDATGNLYGTNGGVKTGNGAVFKLTRNSDGSWTETTIHRFDPYHNNDGGSPSSGLTVDASGSLWGTTLAGGTNGAGTVYLLLPRTGGGWSYHVIYNFDGVSQAWPTAGVTLGPGHTLFGVTGDDTVPYSGGVYEITPW
jgi:uncharacterized repeat protein (TIGR03803 family)